MAYAVLVPILRLRKASDCPLTEKKRCTRACVERQRLQLFCAIVGKANPTVPAGVILGSSRGPKEFLVPRWPEFIQERPLVLLRWKHATLLETHTPSFGVSKTSKVFLLFQQARPGPSIGKAQPLLMAIFRWLTYCKESVIHTPRCQ